MPTLRDFKIEMLEYLPWFERKSKEFNSILNAYTDELAKLEIIVNKINKNILLDTAEESLSIHERDLDILNIAGLNFTQRREQISSRYRASFAQTTEQSMINVAKAYTNGEVQISETDTVGEYEVTFSGLGVPDNIDSLKKSFTIIVPAHLSLLYKFEFSIWSTISGVTWGEAVALSWHELMIWEGDI